MKRELRILMIEDTPTDVVLINHELRRGGLHFHSKRVDSESEFRSEIDLRPPDVILSDHGLPSFDGFAALRIAREKCPQTPFIFVTNAKGEEIAIESLKKGAADYVLKEHLPTLVPAVERALRVAEGQQQRGQTALAESEARNAAILETSLDAIISIDNKGMIRGWNPAAERIFGYSRSEAVGEYLDKLIIPPSLGERYLSGLADYLITGVGSLIGRPIELVARRAGGAEFPVELAIARTPAGEPPLFTVFVRDITDRKRSEEGLRQSEMRKAAVIETALDAIVAIDHQGLIIEWNPTAEKTFGYSRALAVGRNMAELIIPPSYLESHREGFVRHLRSNRGRLIGQRTEMTAMRANGAEFPIEIAITRTTGTGDPTFIAYIRDITERRRMEDDLRKSEERFRLLVESVEDYAIYMLDVRGRVMTWNSGAERIEGYRAQDAVRHKFTLFYTPEEVAQGKPDEALAVAKAEGGFVDERWRIRKDGTRYWANTVVTALRDEKGELYGFSVISRDMTRQKEAEERSHRQNAELEGRVKERTAELQTAYEEMEAFSYSVSHDLRAPLVHIAGFAEILQQDAGSALDERCRHYLQTISESARRMGKMIDDLLAFSRMGRAELHKIRIDVGEMVKGIIRDLRADTQNRLVSWSVSELPNVLCDPALLRQALYNLLSNALKYTRTRPEARIEIGSKPGDGETVFHVRDNGVGFDSKYAEKLFGVFQRLHSAAEFEGTGIGLANVRRIIQRHGGRVWAESTVDQGATFYFSIPASP